VTKTLVVLALVVAVGATFLLACPSSANCPIDNSSSYFTGETTTVDGHLMGKYKCNLHQHAFWVRCD
jgi:hypothetical protein